jgi:hypothetical protein
VIRALLLLAAAPACGGECVAVDTACSPLYEPTFQNVFERTLMPTCATGGAACHATDGAQKGLRLDEIELAYALLGSRLEPSDASCSHVVARLESTDAGYQMPPGRRLGDAERCSIERWIQAGASR